MSIPEKHEYLSELCDTLSRRWPDNRTVNLVCHGHSVPSGYACTPMVDPFHAYPHLMHRTLAQRFPYAVINVIVTAIGGENSVSGAERFQRDVLDRRPDLVTIDYGLNDRGVGLEKARDAWRSMLDLCGAAKVPVILLTPTLDAGSVLNPKEGEILSAHAEQIRGLASEYGVGLCDPHKAFQRYLQNGGDINELLSWINHPNRLGHEMIARELSGWFPMHG
jgi:lysophospholipase L1-like esterase